MPSFPKPSFRFNYRASTEIQRLRKYRNTKPGRYIPQKSNKRLLIATWNIANLGEQKRRDKDHRILAEIISWFDIIALQEVKDNLSGLRGIQNYLPGSYRTTFSDKGGNDERMVYLYDANKISQLEKVGEVAVPPKEIKYIKLPGIRRKFKWFDRNPYLAAFSSGAFEFVLVNVHLFFGEDTKMDRERRALEAYAVSRWADLRCKNKNAYVEDIIVLGDFNIPKVEPGDKIYSALRKRGLQRPPHSTQIASSISTDAEYDQIMFFSGKTDEEFTGNIGVFDFDGAIFKTIWEDKTTTQFNSYVRYYISDHRPLWAEFNI